MKSTEWILNLAKEINEKAAETNRIGNCSLCGQIINTAKAYGYTSAAQMIIAALKKED